MALGRTQARRRKHTCGSRPVAGGAGARPGGHPGSASAWPCGAGSQRGREETLEGRCDPRGPQDGWRAPLTGPASCRRSRRESRSEGGRPDHQGERPCACAWRCRAGRGGRCGGGWRPRNPVPRSRPSLTQSSRASRRGSVILVVRLSKRVKRKTLDSPGPGSLRQPAHSAGPGSRHLSLLSLALSIRLPLLQCRVPEGLGNSG